MIFGGILIGCMFKMDCGVVLFIFIGSGICGVVVILGVELIIQIKLYKMVVVVFIVVIFGILFMFIYFILYRNGIFVFLFNEMGIFIGVMLYEVVYIVGVGNVMGKEVLDVVIIVKMICVMMLVFVLLIISFMVFRVVVKVGG